VPVAFAESVTPYGPRFQAWTHLKNLLSRLDPLKERDPLCANAVTAAFARGELATPDDVDRALEAFLDADRRLHAGLVP